MNYQRYLKINSRINSRSFMCNETSKDQYLSIIAHWKTQISCNWSYRTNRTFWIPIRNRIHYSMYSCSLLICFLLSKNVAEFRNWVDEHKLVEAQTTSNSRDRWVQYLSSLWSLYLHMAWEMIVCTNQVTKDRRCPNMTPYWK